MTASYAACANTCRSAPTFHVVTPPRFVGAGIRPLRLHRQIVGALALKSAFTTGNRTFAEFGSESKDASAGLIGGEMLRVWVAIAPFTLKNNKRERLGISRLPDLPVLGLPLLCLSPKEDTVLRRPAARLVYHHLSGR
jgi:hypothetical protein